MAQNPNSSARQCAYHRFSLPVFPVHTRPVCAGKLRACGHPADFFTFINAYLPLWMIHMLGLCLQHSTGWCRGAGCDISENISCPGRSSQRAAQL